MDELLILIIKAIVKALGSSDKNSAPGLVRTPPPVRMPALALIPPPPPPQRARRAPPPPPTKVPAPETPEPGEIPVPKAAGDLTRHAAIRRRFIVAEILRPPIALRGSGT